MILSDIIFVKCMSHMTTWPWKLPMTVLHMCSLNIWLRAMLDLWHCHRTSLWLCMNMKMSSKHLYNEHDMMFQTCIVRYFNSLLTTLLLHGTRYVRKYSNSICLTRHGSYGRLQDGGKVSPQTSLKCHPTETIARHFSNPQRSWKQNHDVTK